MKALGDKTVKAIEIDTEYKGSNEIKLSGLFIEVGSVPAINFSKKLGIETDKNDYIIIDQGGYSNVKGVYAAGDITNSSNGLHQIVTAVSEGAIATTSIYGYLKK